MKKFWVVSLGKHMSDVAFMYHKACWVRKINPSATFPQEVEEFIDWIRDNMEKECDVAYCPDGRRDFHKFFFYSKDDALKFKLRWGGE